MIVYQGFALTNFLAVSISFSYQSAYLPALSLIKLHLP